MKTIILILVLAPIISIAQQTGTDKAERCMIIDLTLSQKRASIPRIVIHEKKICTKLQREKFVKQSIPLYSTESTARLHFYGPDKW